MRIYLDHNATTPVSAEARAAVAEALEMPGNPSSIHAEGRAARDLVERARRQVAALLSAAAEEVVFTSGGTEANHLALVGAGRRVIAAAVEHPSVLGVADETIPVDGAGRVDLAALESALAAGGPAVVAVALANHELGTVQDLAAVARAAAAHGAEVHCDAVQSAGRMRLEVGALGADTVAISGHKIYGPKGVGALWIRRGIERAPIAPGGHQERERRPGTENLAGIAGLGAAAELAAARLDEDRAHLEDVGAALERGLVELGARLHGAEAPRVPGVVNAGFEGAPGELVVQALDLAGVAVSTGAACTSGTVSASPVLLALGLPRERALEAVRFSAGRGTTRAEVRAVLEMLPDIIARIRAFA
ncbi:MAG TPA: aminotransferase class V-fold PLP-dependent enzyme [Kofleriaceae bacterium]|nr:aminotransferase class V-fold PLP-dependent enzyme [Kofleriaceae bacterium]